MLFNLKNLLWQAVKRFGGKINETPVGLTNNIKNPFRGRGGGKFLFDVVALDKETELVHTHVTSSHLHFHRGMRSGIYRVFSAFSTNTECGKQGGGGEFMFTWLHPRELLIFIVLYISKGCNVRGKKYKYDKE